MKHSHYQSEASKLEVAELNRLLTAPYSAEDKQNIRSALTLALLARDSDDIIRPRGIDVAHILFNLKVDADSIQVALLSDPWLRENRPTASMRETFGDSVVDRVEKVNWLNNFNEFNVETNHQPGQAELLRRMLLSVVNDARAVLVKLAYRVQRLRILKEQACAARETVALETLEIYAPLANRLGLGQLKWELEDLAFRYLHPEEYKALAKSLSVNRAAREAYVHHFTRLLRDGLDAAGISGRVFGRPKHIYSIWKKMQRKHVPVEELYDLLAVRVILEDVSTCYAGLGVVHALWPHVPREFDDYIASPKDNGYQSLHTVVIGPEERPVEVQIRTRGMHEFAEYGVAAHWRYKEGSAHDAAFDRSMASLRRLLENRDDDETLLDDFRGDILGDEVFVLTPKGQVVRLGRGSTPLDFAYAIHTEVGHRCRGAKVDGRIVPLTYSLKSGEKIEILTAKQGNPSLGWLDPRLGYVHTSHARSKIRQWFRQQDHEKHLKNGRIMLERERHKLGMKVIAVTELARAFHLEREDDVLLALGRGDISQIQLAAALESVAGDTTYAPKQLRGGRLGHSVRKPFTHAVTVQGIPNLMLHFAQCCQPVPGDPIIGYVTLGQGVAVHREDCHNIMLLPEWKRNRLIDVAWGEDESVFPVEIEVQAYDRKGLLKDITHVLAHDHVNILRTHTLTHAEDQSVVMHITLEIQHLAQLSLVLDKIAQIHNVLEARRRPIVPAGKA